MSDYEGLTPVQELELRQRREADVTRSTHNEANARIRELYRAEGHDPEVRHDHSQRRRRVEEAVNAVRSRNRGRKPGFGQVALELGIPDRTFYGWRRCGDCGLDEVLGTRRKRSNSPP